MGMNYSLAAIEFGKRRKGRAVRSWKDDTTIEVGENSELVFMYHSFSYGRNPAGGWSKTKNPGIPIAIITPNNVLTLLFSFNGNNVTVQNRLSELLNCQVYSDMSGHRNKESSIRISKRLMKHYGEAAEWAGERVGAVGNIPYKAGIQFRMDGAGSPVELLNPPEDRSIRVKRESITAASRQTAQLRKLVHVMTRIGAFDDLVKLKLSYALSPVKVDRSSLSDVNLAAPVGDDAHLVFFLGLKKIDNAPVHRYVNNAFVRLTEEERIAHLRQRASKAGMELLRKHLYKATDGYEVIPVTTTN